MHSIAAPHDPGVEGAQAWERSVAEPHAVWDVPVESEKFPRSVRGRLANGFATPNVEPKFRVMPDDAFFCIGSCFARVIERQLRYRGLNVTSMRFRAEPGDPGIGANGVNKYTTASMLNEMRWSLAGVPFPDEAIVPDGSGYRDLQLADIGGPISLERARERRGELREYFGRLKDASVVILTLGLVEVWYDRATQLYLNITPSWDTVQRFPGRFSVHVSDYAENRARIAEMLDLLTAAGRSDLRVILTVSPVPMHRTFTSTDVLTANVYGKSTLRAVAGDIARERANVEYWPAYEIVTVCDRSRAYAPDQSHVSEDAGEEVVRAFLSSFGLQAERPFPEFLEKEYLSANPDVRTAVAEGTFASGYEHWLRHGSAEGRSLRP